MTMSKIVRVRWRLLRPGATVISEDETDLEHEGSTVSALFWDGVREHHCEDDYARVRLSESTRPRERERHGS